MLEAGRTLVPIEITTTDRPRLDDARHLVTFREEYRKNCRPALLVHTGDRAEWLAPGILAVPWWQLL